MQRNSHVTFSSGYTLRRSGIVLYSSVPIQCLLVLMALFCAAPASFAVSPGPAGVPFHFVKGFAVMVPVTVNGQGPYDFMLDTGSTITSVDRELGQELALQTQGQSTVTTLTERKPTAIAVARKMAIGPVAEENVVVMVRDLNGLRNIAPTARGVLGQNALNHADFLLDYKHKVMEFDKDGELARSLEGNHVPLRREAFGNDPQYANLAVHLSVNDNGVREVDFLLDSGAAAPVIFGGIESFGSGYPESFVADTVGRELLANVRDLHLEIDGKSKELPSHVLTSRGPGRNISGLLPTWIFNRLYISNSGGFAVFEPKQKKQSRQDRVFAALPPQGNAPHHGGF